MAVARLWKLVSVCVCVKELYIIYYTIYYNNKQTNTTHYIHYKHLKRYRHVDFSVLEGWNHTLFIASKLVNNVL